ncbi:MAG: hypothetical protein EZS26_003338 [Candidatus Ordinivivax streblomastigis]|uniref:Uncharacterized protein n=1 Tax=Candidatus Ordinivivax streblomastigis TaxID=2540710 RepID=A0A5M8NV57_9BACT|nr:MAG: hypothetical protein EZS26_003338 [Candidatus Ordinivivax streblomastigis]
MTSSREGVVKDMDLNISSENTSMATAFATIVSPPALVCDTNPSSNSAFHSTFFYKHRGTETRRIYKLCVSVLKQINQ